MKAVETAGADYIHFDVMTDSSVPNISIGLPVLASLRQKTEMVLDVHLMIDQRERFVEDFIQAGADIVTVHVGSDKPSTVSCNKSGGRFEVWVVLNPHTPLSRLSMCSLRRYGVTHDRQPWFRRAGVHLPSVVPKIAALHEKRVAQGLHFEIEIDGG